MNVVMLCESAELTGGAERVAISESIELAQRGHMVHYIAAGKHAYQTLLDAGVMVTLIDTGSFFEAEGGKQKLQLMLFNPDVVTPISNLLGSLSPSDTVFHAHTYRLKLSGKAIQIAQAMGFRTVIHGHDYSPICPTSLYYDHNEQSPCTLRPLSSACWRRECQGQAPKYRLPKMTSAWMNTKVFQIYARAAAILHVSTQAQEVIQSHLAHRNHVLISPPHTLSPSKRVTAEKNKAFAYVGRLTPEKDPERFLMACEKVGVSAVVIGEGPLRESLSVKYPSAQFVGWANDSLLDSEFAKMRGLVVPSRWLETYGLSVVDAMSRGIPCIVSNRVGAKDWVDDGVNGVIFESADETALETTLDRFMDDCLVGSYSERAYESIWSRPPTIANHVDQLLGVYEGILGGAKR
jgi:glycosyltransferase involved in cell wall biosynthesis